MRAPVKSGNVYGYARVSVVRSGQQDPESVEIQRRKIEGRAVEVGQPLVRVFEDRGVSGSRPLDERPQGKLLLGTVKAGDTVIASKLDRMFRSASDALRVLEDFKRRRISLILLDLGGDVTGDGIARMVFTILSAVAQFERERIAERIRESKAHFKEQGCYLGGARPFGYRVDAQRHLEPDHKEQRAIAAMRALRQCGTSLRAIAQRMKKQGFTLSHVAVQRVLGAKR